MTRGAPLGVAEDHIFFLPKENNWWGPAGVTGPCGRILEMFIEHGKACQRTLQPGMRLREISRDMERRIHGI